MFRKGVQGAAPLDLYWKHVGNEKALGRILTKHDCDPGLWPWATSYLKQDTAAFLERRECFLDKIHQLFLRHLKIISGSRIVPGTTSTMVRGAANRRNALLAVKTMSESTGTIKASKSRQMGVFVSTLMKIKRI